MEFLLEIMTEELPSSHVRSALAQLQDSFRQELQAARIGVNGLRTLGTCRRLVVVADLEAGQPDEEEVVTGPPRQVAVQPDGSYTQAALGFARSQGVPVDKLEVIKTARGEYLGFKRLKKGRPAEEVIAEIFPAVINSLSFPKNMRWGERNFRFSRPIKNLLCLFDGRVVPLELAGLRSSHRTRGHFVHSPVEFEVSNFEDYKKKLGENRVVVEPDERQQSIRRQFEEKLAGLKAEVYPDQALLERLLWNVECPLVIMGSFPESYLELPLEVLSTAMREGQKLFSVVSGRKQLPLFLGIADAPADPRNHIASGNERVLKARLEDARFFWKNDLKVSLADRVPQLKNVIFQEKLGTYGDKVGRLQKLVAYLADRLEMKKEKKDLVEAARLCKADLLTDMVREFPELQGKMGGLYSRQQGWSETVSRAIYEHYLPEGLEDPVPSTAAGAVLSLADKLDTVVGVFGVGISISGSSDPFGLRRQALAICKILLEKKFQVSLHRLLEKAMSLLSERLTVPREQLKASLLEFFEGRLRFIFEKQGYRYDLVNAALGPGIEFPVRAEARLKALNELKGSPNFEQFILMVKRVKNIVKEPPRTRLNSALLREKEEKELYSALKIIKKNAEEMLARNDFASAQKMVFRLQSPLNNFFEAVLVMAEDKKVRNNRLALLSQILELTGELADYSQVVVESENR
ncbi:MAG: glycine--tRNA ligase subunit beta [Candidatus Saccharicenans sp.]|jgi:glycyl-tRNA synthetase beta chain|nr:glycine--tRNA ligase subunit beta [Candidatus Saccharicenans sp.]MDH7574346.1 glycine--tRNA ligase subunit beta [Candidatus Saccharicenans sp.]